MGRLLRNTAILILILYFLGWLPGLVVNLIRLLMAAFEKKSYDSVQGFGCLVWLLIVCGIVPILFSLALAFTLVHTISG